MAKEFAGDVGAIRKASAKEVARAIAMNRPTQESARRAFDDLALVLALIPDLSQWTRSEKKELAQIIRAKAGADESVYARRLQGHSKLRAAIIKMGEPFVP
jgi:hypothetical protein